MANTRIAANDVFPTTNRRITDEGYLTVRANIARTGVQTYRAYELGLDNLPPMKIVKLYRSPDQVFDAASMKSFDGKPITVDHPDDMVTAANWKELSVGDAVNIQRDTNFMAADLTVRDREGVKAIDAGKKELSNGYTFDLDMTPGTSPDGEAYDGLQKNIRGNHIALVDAARCGSACRIGDSKTPTQPTKGRTMTQKIVVDGIPLELGDTEAAMVNKLVGDLAVARKATTDALESHKVALAAKDKDIDALKAQVMTPAARDAMVAEWAGVLASAKLLAPKIATDGKTCAAIRKEVLTLATGADSKSTAKAAVLAVLGGVAIDAADDASVKTAYNVLVASSPKPAGRNANDSAVADALLGDGSSKDPDMDEDDDNENDDVDGNDSARGKKGADKGPKLHGRDAFMARSRNAFQTSKG